ncbi:MAG: biotin-dependent carboxyltransferase family protein [Gemmatimonadaceae bacterium]
MNTTFRIVTGGLQTTIQDLGRVGHQSAGVPGGGAMDRAALRIANLLVGNDDGAAAIEAALIGPAITFDGATLVAVAGGDLEPSVNGAPVPSWHPIMIPRGGTLRFGRARFGCRAYIAIAGGIDVPMVFGSRSTYLRAEFGGFEGRALRSGDLLQAGAPSALSARLAASLPDHGAVARWSIGGTLRPRYSDDIIVRLIPGAHAGALNDVSRERLFDATFHVSSNSDRMGYRLEGVELALDEPIELLSEGVVFGTVQLPPSGVPIVLMADGQTTGGYPRIGEVATVDLPLMAQLKPGDRVRFRPISVQDAQKEYFNHERELTQARYAIALRR